MKANIFWLLVCLAFTPAPIRAEGILTGDTRLACEAILCLSSGVRPGECSPALDRYFGITRKTFDATQAARMAFLNLCPASSDPGMPGLVEAIVNGAGRCNAALLNRVLARTEYITVCDDQFWGNDGSTCRDEPFTYIDDRLPAYCKAYTTHEWSWKLGVHYVGEKKKGGKWVDE